MKASLDDLAEAANGQTVLDQLIDDFNNRYAVVNEAGKVWIFQWRLDPVLDRGVLDHIAHRDFKLMYENDLLTVITIDEDNKPKPITKSKAAWWLAHRRRKQYLGGVTFDPTGKAPPEYLNLWRGFSVEPKPGSWSLMRNHICNVICSGVEEYYDYVIKWIARTFQYPSEQGETAIVMRGGEGVGKGIFCRWVIKAFGQHGIQIFHPAQFVGRFNDHLWDCVALFADEAFFAGDRAHERVLKGLITEPFIPIEGKFQRIITVRNMLHVMIASNSEWVIPASHDARRYAVFDVLDTHAGDRKYFEAIERQMETGGLAAMLHDLLAVDISDFDFRNVPQTDALRHQKALSLPSLERWWLAVLRRGFLYAGKNGASYFQKWQEFYTTELLHRSYLQWCNENRPRERKSREELGKFMTELYQGCRPRGKHPVYELERIDIELIKAGRSLNDTSIVWQDRPPGYRVGDLEEAYAKFLDKYDLLRDADETAEIIPHPATVAQ
jgi:hypothetical protein